MEDKLQFQNIQFKPFGLKIKSPPLQLLPWCHFQINQKYNTISAFAFQPGRILFLEPPLFETYALGQPFFFSFFF